MGGEDGGQKPEVSRKYVASDFCLLITTTVTNLGRHIPHPLPERACEMGRVVVAGCGDCVDNRSALAQQRGGLLGTYDLLDNELRLPPRHGPTTSG